MMQTYLPLLRNVRRDVTMCSWTLPFGPGGNKKLVIYITLQTICLLAICLCVRKNVNRGRDITGFLLYVQEKNHQKMHLQGMKDIALPPEGEQVHAFALYRHTGAAVFHRRRVGWKNGSPYDFGIGPR